MAAYNQNKTGVGRFTLISGATNVIDLDCIVPEGILPAGRYTGVLFLVPNNQLSKPFDIEGEAIEFKSSERCPGLLFSPEMITLCCKWNGKECVINKFGSDNENGFDLQITYPQSPIEYQAADQVASLWIKKIGD